MRLDKARNIQVGLYQCKCCPSPPPLVPSASPQVDLVGSGTKVTWLDVAGSATSTLMQLAAAGIPAAGAAAASCLGLLRCLAASHPLRVLTALQRVPQLFPAAPADNMLSGAGQLSAAIPLSALWSRSADADASECGCCPCVSAAAASACMYDICPPLANHLTVTF